MRCLLVFLVMLVLSPLSVCAAGSADFGSVAIDQLITDFDKSAGEGRYRIYEQILEKSNLDLISVSVQKNIKCDTSTVVYKARLMNQLEAKGELSGLGAAVIMVTIEHRSNGTIEVFPVIGSFKNTAGNQQTIQQSLSCKK